MKNEMFTIGENKQVKVDIVRSRFDVVSFQGFSDK